MRVLLGSLIAMLGVAIAQAQPASLVVRTDAVGERSEIPVAFTCNGASLRPTVSWSQPPAGTKSIALLIDDPDAPSGMFVHLLAVNIPPMQSSLALSRPLPMGVSVGRNGTGKVGYFAPCPPNGMHHYHFRVYALDRRAPDAQGLTRMTFLQAVKGHVLAQGELIGIAQSRVAEESGGTR
jgi:Raf kinase inhibitor-like YbhB/YbcL family protein